MKVAVIGAGFAGVSAAFAARRCGAEVTLVQQGAGASSLYSGGVDGPRLEATQDHGLGELAAALGLRLDARTVIATREGVVRAASGRDGSLLDLAPLAGKRVAVVDVARDDWDGPLLARAFAASAWARATRTRFDLVPLELLEKGHQRRVSPFDFAAGFERAERPAWLAQLLKAHAGPDAWLFGPWLGVRRDLAVELASGAGVPVGEVTSPPGGVAGARFERRRDALLASLQVHVLGARAVRVSFSPDSPDAGVAVLLAGGSELRADALVLACGGFVSGAIGLSGALSGAEPAGFQLEIAGLPPLLAGGGATQPVSSLFGVDLAARGLSSLESVGLPTAASGVLSGASRVFACGDVTGPQPPSVGHALVSGLRAGRAAASVRL